MRVFLALWPDEAVRRRLAEEADRVHRLFGGRRTRRETIHLTLVFIGNLARDQLPDLVAELRAVCLPGFEVVFDRVDCWKHNRIGHLSATETPDGLARLVSELETALDRLGIVFDRRPYKAHITVVRKANCKKGDPAGGRVAVSSGWDDFSPIRWSADNFVLVESALSSEGSTYRVVERFALS